MGASDQHHDLATLYPQGKGPPIPTGQVGLRTSLNTEGTGKYPLPLLRIETWSSSPETLYRLHSAGSHTTE